jgi:hypothetical protein
MGMEPKVSGRLRPYRRTSKNMAESGHTRALCMREIDGSGQVRAGRGTLQVRAGRSSRYHRTVPRMASLSGVACSPNASSNLE